MRSFFPAILSVQLHMAAKFMSEKNSIHRQSGFLYNFRKKNTFLHVLGKGGNMFSICIFFFTQLGFLLKDDKIGFDIGVG